VRRKPSAEAIDAASILVSRLIDGSFTSAVRQKDAPAQDAITRSALLIFYAVFSRQLLRGLTAAAIKWCDPLLQVR
jgi:hypothetical protein